MVPGTVTMTQPVRTADELLLARAEANGYQRGVHREADEVRGREKHVKTTIKNQDGTLRRYILYVCGAAWCLAPVSLDMMCADPAAADGTSER